MITSGIEKSLAAVDNVKNISEIYEEDFTLKNTFQIFNPSLCKYRKSEFADYAPKVFSLIRNYNQISREEYLDSLGTHTLNSIISGNINSFKGLDSSGKSGSFFFTSFNNKFFVKTIPEREFRVALGILRDYLNYLDSCYKEGEEIKSLFMK